MKSFYMTKPRIKYYNLPIVLLIIINCCVCIAAPERAEIVKLDFFHSKPIIDIKHIATSKELVSRLPGETAVAYRNGLLITYSNLHNEYRKYAVTSKATKFTGMQEYGYLISQLREDTAAAISPEGDKLCFVRDINHRTDDYDDFNVRFIDLHTGKVFRKEDAFVMSGCYFTGDEISYISKTFKEIFLSVVNPYNGNSKRKNYLPVKPFDILDIFAMPDYARCWQTIPRLMCGVTRVEDGSIALNILYGNHLKKKYIFAPDDEGDGGVYAFEFSDGGRYIPLLFYRGFDDWTKVGFFILDVASNEAYHVFNSSYISTTYKTEDGKSLMVLDGEIKVDLFAYDEIRKVLIVSLKNEDNSIEDDTESSLILNGASEVTYVISFDPSCNANNRLKDSRSRRLP